MNSEPQHKETRFNRVIPTRIRIAPTNDASSPDALNWAQAAHTILNDDEGDQGLAPPVPRDLDIARGRAPVMYQPEGYAILEPGNAEIEIRDEEIVGEDGFERATAQFRSKDGKYMAMTCYGAVEVPEEILAEIPKEFEAEPMIEECEHFVPKQVKHERVVEKEFVEHQHHFVEILKSGVVDKLVPKDEEKVIQIPQYTYKGVIAENVIEVPQGTRYVEVPMNVAMKKPPKIVHVPYPIVIVRNIECTKPVVQERVIEVPRVVRKAVPKHIVKEVPFVVPKYVEHIVEVPFNPQQEGVPLNAPPPQGRIVLPQELPPTPPDFEAVGVTTGFTDKAGHSLVVDTQGRYLYFCDGTPFVDATGAHCTLADNGQGWVDGLGNYHRGGTGTEAYTINQPATESGATDNANITPQSPDAQPTPNSRLLTPGFGGDGVTPSPLKPVGTPIYKPTRPLTAARGPGARTPGFAHSKSDLRAEIERSQGATPAFCGDEKEITLELDANCDGPQTVLVPSDVKAINLPFEAEIEVSVVACDPVTGEVIEEVETPEPPKPETPPQYEHLPAVPKEVLSSYQAEPGMHSPSNASEGSFVGSLASRLRNVFSPSSLTPAGSPAGSAAGTPGQLSPRPSTKPSNYRYESSNAYAVPMTPVVQYEQPTMQAMRVQKIGGSTQVVTNKGVKSLDTLHWTCGDPVAQLQPPYRQDKVPIPLKEDGSVDIDSLNRVQAEYSTRIRTKMPGERDPESPRAITTQRTQTLAESTRQNPPSRQTSSRDASSHAPSE